MLDRKEVLRYLGCRTEDALLERMAVQAEKLVLQAAAPVHVFRRTGLYVWKMIPRMWERQRW